MYEERRWGEYKVIDTIECADGHRALTKQLVIKAGKNISNQVHNHRDEVWTFVDGKVQTVTRGDVINIKKGTKHAVKAITDLRFIEVQSGDTLIEEDILRFDWTW
jgi:mannose-1-phosphate guanylyltransferase